MNLPIPFIETRGTPYAVGYQIGIAAHVSLREMHAATRAEYRENWEQLLRAAMPFQRVTAARLPKVMQEIRGCAEGAKIPFDDLFLMSVEELLYEEVRGFESRGGGHAPAKNKGCSDLAAAPPATVDGHVWLAHNNDLGADALEHLFITRFCVEGEPEILAVTVGGLFISVGMNHAGISLTGNQLNANDSRVGVPRLLIVRELLAQTTLDEALTSALISERASSYNNIIASRGGQIVNVEGSATAAALTWTDETGGTLAHTNHYLAAEMLPYEADARHVAMSASRCARAFDYANKYRGQIGYDICARFVRDHVYAPWSVCKHAGQSVTVFSTLMDLTALRLWVARGNPCLNEFVEYGFASETPLRIAEPEFAVAALPRASSERVEQA